MNRRTLVLLSSLGVAALCGCASTQTGIARTPAAAAPTSSLLQEDQAYVQYVERVARRRGIHVVWVNKPLGTSAAQAGTQ